MDKDTLVWWSSKQQSSEVAGRRAECEVGVHVFMVCPCADVQPGTEEPDYAPT